VFSGMLGVTFFGLIFTPVFYTVMRKFARKRQPPQSVTAPASTPNPAPAE
jgi:HAE1 family hydrophobic/amphiphilic exporter-1